MSCYISSNDNRFYAAIESNYGAVSAIAEENRLPAVRLAVEQVVETPARRDKTGGRTWVGMPAGLRKRTSFDLLTYMTGWTDGEAEPCYGPLFQAALGGAPITFAGGTVASSPEPARLTMTAAHGLVVNQAVAYAGEIRFVTAIVDPLTVVLNAPFTATVGAGTVLTETVTYLPATSLPSVSVYDFWSPAAAVHRVLPGGAVNRMVASINGDFHQFRFQGESSGLVDSVSFEAGQAGLTTFPVEPAVAEANFSLVPGSLGQAWIGAELSQFHTVLEAEITVDNDIDLRRREFGRADPQCIVAGIRNVGVNLRLVSNTEAETTELYQAAVQRSPVGMLLQLGQQERQLCGIYLPALIPEVPVFDDGQARLEWRFENCRAQGVVNDECVIAFA